MARLGGYTTHRDVADMSNLFKDSKDSPQSQISFIFILSLYDQGRWHAYRDFAFRSEMSWTKIDTNTPAWRDKNYTNAYVPI